MSSKILIKTEIQQHKKTHGKQNVIITTIVKKNQSKMSPDDVKKIAEKMMISHPKKKLMIKVLSANGYFQLKGYNDSLDVILSEEIYLNGVEAIDGENYNSIYKASFYLI